MHRLLQLTLDFFDAVPAAPADAPPKREAPRKPRDPQPTVRDAFNRIVTRMWDEIRDFLAQAPVVVDGPYGVVFSPLTGRWTESTDTDVNYMMTVVRDAA